MEKQKETTTEKDFSYEGTVAYFKNEMEKQGKLFINSDELREYAKTLAGFIYFSINQWGWIKSGKDKGKPKHCLSYTWNDKYFSFEGTFEYIQKKAIEANRNIVIKNKLHLVYDDLRNLSNCGNIRLFIGDANEDEKIKIGKDFLQQYANSIGKGHLEPFVEDYSTGRHLSNMVNMYHVN